MRTAALLRTGRVSLHTHPIRGVVGAQCFSYYYLYVLSRPSLSLDTFIYFKNHAKHIYWC